MSIKKQISDENTILIYFSWFFFCLELGLFGAENANAEKACTEVAYAMDNYAVITYIRGTYIGDTSVKSVKPRALVESRVILAGLGSNDYCFQFLIG